MFSSKEAHGFLFPPSTLRAPEMFLGGGFFTLILYLFCQDPYNLARINSRWVPTPSLHPSGRRQNAIVFQARKPLA